MSEMKKVATRDSYGNAITELAKEHDDVVVFEADLSSATKTGIFKKAFPDRHINCGIAEGNMMAVAAGASTMGLVPFASSFASAANASAPTSSRSFAAFARYSRPTSVFFGQNSFSASSELAALRLSPIARKHSAA